MLGESGVFYSNLPVNESPLQVYNMLNLTNFSLSVSETKIKKKKKRLEILYRRYKLLGVKNLSNDPSDVRRFVSLIFRSYVCIYVFIY